MTNFIPRQFMSWLVLTWGVCACSATDVQNQESLTAAAAQEAETQNAMLIQYLEVVTPDVEATCNALAQLHGIAFGEAVPGLGNARTAALQSGGMIGVRAPMAAHENPVVRPYVLVDDIEAAVTAAQSAGAQIALPAMEIPGHGMFAIYILGGIEHGLWQI